jgi:hypothetical protein
MAINRVLQDKINLLSDDELEALGKDYIGKQCIVLWDNNFHIETIKSFEVKPFDYNMGENRVGDKNILFETENEMFNKVYGRFLNLLDFAIVGDTLNVMDKDEFWQNLMIAEIKTDGIINKIEFDNGEKIEYGNTDNISDRVLPKVMDIGWLDYKQPITFGIDWSRNDILDFGNKIYYVTKVSNVYNPSEKLIEYAFLDKNDELSRGEFRESEFEKYFVKKPELYRLDEGDIFATENSKITINKIYKKPNSSPIQLAPKLVDYTRYGILSGNILDETETITNLLEYLVDNKFSFVREEKVEPKPLNMEGDFIAEFLNNNASDLLELEKNNRPLFDVVEMTLNLLNKKFGKGDSIGEKVDEVIDNAEEIITNVQGKDPNLIGLKEIKVEWNEGTIELNGKVFTSWTEFTNALKPLYDTSVQGYNKVKFKATFDDGKYIIDRVDVGVNDFNPNTMKVGEYIDRPFAYFDNLNDDLDKYQWDDVVVITEGGEEEITKEDIENEIKALEISMMLEEDEDKVKEIEQKIYALNISLTLI